LYRFRITKIFQTSILFETNKFHHGGPLAAGGPGQLSPLPSPFNPDLAVTSPLLTALNSPHPIHAADGH